MNVLKFKLHHFVIILFTTFPLLPNRLKGLPVILLFLVAFYIFLKERVKKYPLNFVLKFSSLFLILLFSLIYTANFTNINILLTAKLSLIVVPISIGFLASTERKIDAGFLSKFSKIYFFITTIYSCWILIFLNELGVFTAEVKLVDAIAYITNEMWLISQHPIYASIFISISILLIVNIYFKEKNINFILYTLPLVLIQFFTLLVLERKGVLFSFMLSLLIMLYFFIKEKVSSKFLRNLILIFTVVISTFVFTSSRFKELYKKENYSNVLEFNSTSLRFGIYKCSLEKIKESPFFGFGIGDVQHELDKCYEKKSKLLTEIKYNSHNQYLSYFLSSGILGFLILIFLLISIFLRALKNKHIILLTLTVFFAINMLFENILERQSGVILFSFYLCVFSFINLSKNED